MNSPRLSIIIPTKDRGEVFISTLQSAIAATNHLGVEIIVVNDAKDSLVNLPAEATNVKLFNNPKSGVASARNFGAKHSTGNILLFLDDDICISKKSIDHILTLHTQYAEACFNVNWVYPIELKSQLSKTSFGRFLENFGMDNLKGWFNDPSWLDNALFPAKSLASFHLSISKINFEKTGGYNENFPFAGFEDYDFPVRMKKLNLAFYIDSRVTVFHNEADRIEIKNWLNNWMRRGATRKVAVNMGYNELTLNYNWIKRTVLNLLFFTLPLMFFVLEVIPNNKSYDRFYFKLISIIQAVKIYKGYNSIS